MDVNTGAILAMVTANGYDLNNPYQLSDEEQKKIDALPENEQDAAESAALSAMWRNKAVADTYEPGSVFKMCTASMVLEEGLVNLDTSTFYCAGSMTIADADPIHCHNLAGHGTQSFTEAIVNHVTLLLCRWDSCLALTNIHSIIKHSVLRTKQELTFPVRLMTSSLQIWMKLTLR